MVVPAATNLALHPDDPTDSANGESGAAQDPEATLPPPSPLGRLSQAYFKLSGGRSKADPDPDPDRPLTDRELKAKVTKIDQTERRIGYLGAGLGAVMALTFTVPYISSPRRAPRSRPPPMRRSCRRAAACAINSRPRRRACRPLCSDHLLAHLLVRHPPDPAGLPARHLGDRSYRPPGTPGLRGTDDRAGLRGDPGSLRPPLPRRRSVAAHPGLEEPALRIAHRQAWGSAAPAERRRRATGKAAVNGSSTTTGPARGKAPANGRRTKKPQAAPTDTSRRRPTAPNKRYTPKAPPKKKVPPPT